MFSLFFIIWSVFSSNRPLRNLYLLRGSGYSLKTNSQYLLMVMRLISSPSFLITSSYDFSINFFSSFNISFVLFFQTLSNSFSNTYSINSPKNIISLVKNWCIRISLYCWIYTLVKPQLF